MRPRQQRPSTDEFLRAFEGRIYGVASPAPVVGSTALGWGSSALGVLDHIRLKFRIGPRGDDVVVETYRSSSSVALERTAQSSLFLDLATREWRDLPVRLTLARTELTVDVGGAGMSFDALTCARAAVAYATIDGSHVLVHAPSSRLRRLSLGLMDRAALAAILEDRPR